MYVVIPSYPQMLTKLASCHKPAKQLVSFPVAWVNIVDCFIAKDLHALSSTKAHLEITAGLHSAAGYIHTVLYRLLWMWEMAEFGPLDIGCWAKNDLIFSR